MKISIGSDHAGFELKQNLINYLSKQNIQVKDSGCFNIERADYPDYAHIVASDVINKEVDCGILICGSGNGINITANKHKGIRSALCWNKEIVALARQHNNANILSIPARFTALQQVIEMVDTFFETKFEGGRHQSRIDKIPTSC